MILVFLFMLINFADKAVIGLASVPIMQDLRLDHRQFGLLGSAFFLLFSVSGVVVGLMFSWFYDPTFGLLKLILGHGVPVLGDARYVTFGIHSQVNRRVARPTRCRKV